MTGYYPVTHAQLSKKPKTRPTARKAATCRSWCGRLAAAARGAVCLELRGGTGRWVQQKTVDNTICVQLDVQISAQGV